MVTAAMDDLAQENDSAPPSAPRAREGKELIDATRPFAVEDRARSWWHVGETLGVLTFLIALAASLPLHPWWPLRVVASVLAGLTVVRGFILFHDYQHGAILKGSTAAKWLFELYGLYVLSPASVWKQTHNYHHAHTAKIVGSHIGSFMMLTTDMWEKCDASQRRAYRALRSPLTMVLGYFTVFAWGMCVSPYLRDRRKHKLGPVALGLHLAVLAHALPLFVAFASGSYLFYAQHNYPGVHVAPRETWSYTRAALESSSYMECGPVMAWFTGNIGYHHVHHLNPTVPFYRLPEAMAAIPELRHPVKTSLRPRDVLACLRLKLWDPARNQMVPFPD